MGTVHTSQRRKHDTFSSPSSSLLAPTRSFTSPSSHSSSFFSPTDLSASSEHVKGFGHSFEHMAVHRPEPEANGGNEVERVAPAEATNPSPIQMVTPTEAHAEQDQPIQTARGGISPTASSASTLQRLSISAGDPVPPPPLTNRQASTRRSGWSLERLAMTYEQLSPVQRYATSASRASEPSPQAEVLQQEPVEPATPKENTTGLPDHLKAGIESLSGLSLDDVHVHYNSSRPAEVDALAYTQGTEIHVAPGQEQHLAHEAWHVVQQMQGLVKPTLQAKGMKINDDQGLEREADMMGKRAKGLTIANHIYQANEARETANQGGNTFAHKTIQCMGPNIAASAPGLVAEYNNLLLSEEFQAIDVVVTKNQNITLQDSSLLPGQPVDYDTTTHTIRVPLNTPAGVPRPLTDVRDDILWEMHNASIKGALGRTDAKFLVPAPGPGASLEEKKSYPYMQAAYALSTEWEEWINIAEHDLRVEAINLNPAMGVGPHVTRTFANLFAVADQGWYNFETYLQEQITTGHTTGYDPNAANQDWVGKKIVGIVRYGSAAEMQITQKQVQDWKSGKRRKIKSISNNPFKSLNLSSLVWK